MTALSTYRNWIFDMDGTLTIAVHDFPKIKKELGLPGDRGILEVLAEMEPAEAAIINQRLDEIEHELARDATPAHGAHEFLEALAAKNVRLGILTRNKRSHALVTLQACGLLDFFDENYILGREEADPKPSPEGISVLLEAWQVPAAKAVMAGDFRFDLEAGRAAGTCTVYIDPERKFPFRNLADVWVGSLKELMPMVSISSGLSRFF